MLNTTETSSISAIATQHWPVATISVVFIGLALVTQTWLRHDFLTKIPLLGSGSEDAQRKHYLQGGAFGLYKEGYKKFKNQVYRLVTTRGPPCVIIPPEFLDEIKKLPDDIIAFSPVIYDSMQVRYTDIHLASDHLLGLVKSQMTPSLLPQLTKIVADEVEDAIRQELPQSEEWSELAIHKSVVRIIAKASGRAFVGAELCQNESYLRLLTSFTTDLMAAVRAIYMTPWYLRWLLSPRLPEMKVIQQRITEADELLRPIIAARRKAGEDAKYQKPNDILQWNIDSMDEKGDKDRIQLIKNQLSLSWVALHSTTLFAMDVIYWLAAKPELAPMLREDVEQALAESGGEYTPAALNNMKKLDSFLKESSRVTPLTAVNFNRKVLKPIMLSNGQVIPAGVMTETPKAAIYSDETIFPDPEVFDPLRFYNLRQSKTDVKSGSMIAQTITHSQVTSVGKTSLTFGYGRHACPGRFFAMNEIKIILGHMLQEYEIKMPDGVTGRYKSLINGAQSLPDLSKTVMIRKL